MGISSDGHHDDVSSASRIFNREGGWRNETIYGSDGYDILDGEEGNDTLYGFGGDDVLIGGYGNDTLYGGDGNDLIVGDNTFDGVGGSDILYGGEGNDRLYGGYGNDLYIYAANTGMDTINDGRTAAEMPGSGGGVDTLRFNGAILSDIHLQKMAGSDNLLIYSSAGVVKETVQHGVIIQDFFLKNQNTNIEYLEDGRGNALSLSVMFMSDDFSYGEFSAFDLAMT